ncbi:MAG: TspO/MBR family protein [Paracoccaceae bacterium]|nr:TspO/MBR family protein [Paracoccaceae bacterium]
MEWFLFFTFLAACVAPAVAGALFRPGEWYRTLSKPSWTPPNWVFPIVWAFLYVSMSLAAARVAVLPETDQALAFWAVQLAFNTLWSGVFFGLRRMAAGGIIIGILWIAVGTTMVAFWQHDVIAGLLFVPYLVWVSLAFALNWSVWARNRATV